MPIKKYRYQASKSHSLLQADGLKLVNQTSFLLDLYFHLMRRSAGHRVMAINHKFFEYSEAPMTKSAGLAVTNSLAAHQGVKRTYVPIAEGELRRFSRMDGVKDTLLDGFEGEEDEEMALRLNAFASAVEIQRVWRGHRTRYRLETLFDDPQISNESILMDTVMSHCSTGSGNIPLCNDFMFGERVNTKFQKYYNSIGHKHDNAMTYFDYCATLIQSVYRSFAVRLKARRERERQEEERKRQEEIIMAASSLENRQGLSPSPDISISPVRALTPNQSQDSFKPLVGNYQRSESMAEERVAEIPRDIGTPTVKFRYFDQDSAARVIQKIWKRYCFRETFKFLKELIVGFHLNGNPRRILQFINPRESEFMEKAAGVHLRFRLGGVEFPPQIVYKIYTHAPLVDVNAFSPRPNYNSLESLKRALPKHLNLNPINDKKELAEALKLAVKEGWYQRPETNDWRIVSVKTLDPFYPSALIKFCCDKKKSAKELLLRSSLVHKKHHHEKDENELNRLIQEQIFSHVKYAYHHDNLVRRQDLQKRRKEKKRHWLKQMYKIGRKRDESDLQQQLMGQQLMIPFGDQFEDSSKSALGTGTSSSSDDESDSLTELMNNDEIELLEWAHHLDFDDYFDKWFVVGTSGFSNVKKSERMPEEIRNLNVKNSVTLKLNLQREARKMQTFSAGISVKSAATEENVKVEQNGEGESRTISPTTTNGAAAIEWNNLFPSLNK